MAKGRIDANHRANTLKENKMVLCELRSRGKLEQRTTHELNKLFAKLNWENAPKNWKNVKAAASNKQEKMPAEHPYGPVEGFPPGSWWGIRMDCSRDRVHEPFNADIQDGPAGAVSLCTSHLNSHNDEDLGDSLTFTGSSYEPGVQADHPLLRSYHSQVPLRLVRSYNLTNDFAPKTGYRYDGLYTVAAHWIGITSDTEKYHKFALIRVRNQEPPAWKESVAKSTANGKKTNCPQTRCTTERFSTNLSGETNPSASEQDTPSSSRCRTETIKFSFNKFANANATDKATPESKRNTHDSAIVTRCISVKKAECPSSSGMIFVPYSESPVQNANRIHENASKPAPCKLQNTNISIRTDLYDSSHNIQHETKKSIPMTFCRTFVSARNTRVVNHSHVGTLNLNSCGPCPRDGEQESLIQSRSGNSKISATHSPCSESNRSADRSTPKINYVASPVEAKTQSDLESRISEVNGSVDVTDCANNDLPRGNRLQREQRDKENSPTKISNEIADTTSGNGQTVCPVARTGAKKNAETPETERDETRDETLREQRTALDSLTPDQMLKYIVKQKYHPTAKLLIGSVIGLATGESKILRTYDSLMSRNKTWSRDKKLRNERGDSATSVNAEKALDRRQSASDESTKIDRSVAKTGTQKRGINERIFTMRLRRTRVSKRLLGSEKKTNAKKTAESTSKRLRRSKDSEKTQQPFSKSTSLKNSKKNAKKRRSELANLAIDANIGPKIRGPRNRRLRGRSHIFAKKRHDVDISSCCGGSRTDVGARGRKGTSMVELPSKRSKRLSSGTNTRYVQHKKRVRKTETPGVQRKIENSASGASSQGNLAGSTRKGERRKVSQSQSRGGCENSNKRLCRRSEKDTATIKRIITMVDAATQCSNQRDAATCIDADIEGSNASEEIENSVKVEWIDLDDVKSESCESEEDQFVLELASERDESRGELESACEEPEITRKSRKIIPIRPQAEKPQIANVARRLSAFVPVNISDSDFRIARLRSIGFRPIGPVCIHHEKDKCNANCASGSSKETTESTVVSRVADEQYNKYTSEETTVVGYMDQELRYQDIEEDVVIVTRDAKNSQAAGKSNVKVARMRNKKLDAARAAKVEAIKTRRVSASLEDDSEIPWHGWKKFVKNKEAHWVGW